MAIRGTSITPTGVQLTERQSQVLALVRRHIDDTGYPPTRADIARELGFKSANAAEEHLKALALVSRTLRDPMLRSKLRANPDSSTLFTILTEAQNVQAA